jgi:hypothetical protein
MGSLHGCACVPLIMRARCRHHKTSTAPTNAHHCRRNHHRQPPPGFRGGREEREPREPSRADSAADWGSERKFTPSEGRSGGFGGSGGYRERDSGGFGDRGDRCAGLCDCIT